MGLSPCFIFDLPDIDDIRYARGPLIDLVMAILGERNIRPLEALQEGTQDWHKLLDYLRKLQVMVPSPRGGSKKVTIKGLQSAAGLHKFSNNDDGEMISVKVSVYHEHCISFPFNVS